MSYGLAKAEYDENKTIKGEKVASEAARQNVYGSNCHEVVEEMKDVQHIRSPVKRSFIDIVVTLSEEDCEKFTAPNQSKWLMDKFMHDLMTEQTGLSEDDYAQMQWIAYEHAHTDNSDSLKHWHILANRVLLNGKLVSDSWIGKKAARTANKISRQYGLTDAMVRSDENKRDVFKAACFVLGNLRTYDFNKYCKGLDALGYKTSPAINSQGKVQGYYITSQSGRRYKASAVDRRLTIGRLEDLHEALHKSIRTEASRHPGMFFRMPPPDVPQVNVDNMLSVLNVGTGVAYVSDPPSGCKKKNGKRWDEMTDEERRLAKGGMSL